MSGSDVPGLSEEEYRALVEGSPDLVVIATPEARLRYGNAAMASALGFPPPKAGGTEPVLHVHPSDLEPLRTVIRVSLDGGAPQALDVRFRNGAGSWRTFEVAVQRLRDQVAALHCRDVTERRAIEQAFRERASRDEITGLLNRAAFIDRLERTLARARHARHQLCAVLLVDIDRFQLINDGLEPREADQVLTTLSRRLVESLRPADAVAHLGQGQFAVLVEDLAGPAEITHMALRLQRSLAQPVAAAAQEVFATAGVGIALSQPADTHPEELLRKADVALNRAKAEGRGGCEIFDSDMHAEARERLTAETELRQAVEKGELRVHYQPIVSLSKGQISGFEALLRWQHPKRGLLAAAEFVPMAEETGLIKSIGLWIVRTACTQAKAWQEAFPELAPTVAVNLSSHHFGHPEVLEGIQDALDATRLDARRLVLEITESVMMKEIDSVIPVLRALKSLELELHIDDFGTGYSSLSYLHRLPTDALKIDRSFVGRLGIDADAEVMVKTIIDLAHNMGRQVIAEGVETEVQLQRLRALGCDYGQGYYFAHPLDPSAARAILSHAPRW